MKANIFVIVMIYLSISMFMYIGGIRVVQEESGGFLGNFIDIDSYHEGNIAPSDQLKDVVPKSYRESGGGGLLSFIDVLGAIKDFLIFMVNIIFAPIGLFVGSGIPPIAALFIAIPLLVGGVLAFISFIRSGQ